MALVSRIIGRIRRAFQKPFPYEQAAPCGCRFLVTNRSVANRVQSMLTKEPSTVAWLDTIKHTDTLWDIGANIGLFSIYAAVERRCHVIAFEPAASNYALLNRNIEINKVQDNVEAYCLAVSAEDKFGYLNMPKTSDGVAMSMFGSMLNYQGKPFRILFRQGMVGFTLDHLNGQLKPPTHIKLDVDGLESDIILAARSTFEAHALRSIIIELDHNRPELFRNVASHLGQFRFELASTGDVRMVTNYIFNRQN
jgi:FkbM family methyltransferase